MLDTCPFVSCDKVREYICTIIDIVFLSAYFTIISIELGKSFDICWTPAHSFPVIRSESTHYTCTKIDIVFLSAYINIINIELGKSFDIYWTPVHSFPVIRSESMYTYVLMSTKYNCVHKSLSLYFNIITIELSKSFDVCSIPVLNILRYGQSVH